MRIKRLIDELVSAAKGAGHYRGLPWSWENEEGQEEAERNLTEAREKVNDMVRERDDRQTA